MSNVNSAYINYEFFVKIIEKDKKSKKVLTLPLNFSILILRLLKTRAYYGLRQFSFAVFKKGAILMYSKEVVVQNQIGLHARPATFFIQKANEYKSTIWVEKDERKVSAKSLLGVLSLGVTRGTSIVISAEGEDEERAVRTLVDFIKSNFVENE